MSGSGPGRFGGVNRSRGRLLLAGLCLVCAGSAAGASTTGADDREVYRADAPAWLRAVGKLEVPGSKHEEGQRRHYREDCTATLVARGSARQADTIVTAWHCLEFYDDLSKPILFTLLPGSEQSIAREAYRLSDGGGMHADWAVLRLRQPVPGSLVYAMRINPESANPERPVTMAGYSRDDGKGQNGAALSFDRNCRITSASRAGSETDCTAYKGASGGAVMQASTDGRPLFCGVISRGDSNGVSIYVPLSEFRNELERLLR